MPQAGAKKAAQAPLGECPDELLAHMVGTCWSCWRPMVSKRTPAELYDGKLDTWFVRKAAGGQCGTCYPRTLYSRQPRRAARRPRRCPLTPEQVRRDRLAVGACLECGWADDSNAEPHADRNCGTYEAQQLVTRIDEGITRCLAS